jgi:hypothetical protein
VQSSPLVHLAPDRLALSHDPQTVYLASALAIFNLHALQHHNLVCLGGSYPLLLNNNFNREGPRGADVYIHGVYRDMALVVNETLKGI